MIGSGDIIQTLRDKGPLTARTLLHFLDTAGRHGTIDEVRKVIAHCVETGEVEASRVGVDGSTGETIYLAEPAPEPAYVSAEERERRAMRCALYDAVRYLEEDRAGHLKAHGKWSLDPGKLEAAMEYGGLMLSVASIDDDDLAEWEAKVAAYKPAEG